MSKLKAGDNTFFAEINGIQKTIRVNVDGNEVRNINIFNTNSNDRVLGPATNLGKVTW